MNKSIYILGAFCISLYLLYLTIAVLAQDERLLNNPDLMRKDAERIWELAIEAKGGRERLHSVKNMVTSSSGKFAYGLKKINIRNESLYVFAENKSWVWDDQRPSVFGLNMSMHNGERGEEYYISYEGDPFRGLTPINPPPKNTKGAGLIHYFLETKWNKPIPEKVASGKVGSKKVDIVQTRFLGKRADFMLDTESHLLLRVVYYTDQQLSNSIRFYDYVDVNGLKMPSKEVLEQSDGDMEYKITVQLNVEYNENIFKTPPPFEAGPEAWRKK